MKDEEREITFRLGSCERLLMRLSEMPSLKYWTSGSPVRLSNGRTAIESTGSLAEGMRRTPAVPSAAKAMRAATAASGRRFFGEAFAARLVPDSRSLFKLRRSTRSSAALW